MQGLVQPSTRFYHNFYANYSGFRAIFAAPHCLLLDSMVAPYQTSVDLNVIEHFPDNSSSVDERASSAGTPILPPSRADLGACLWGPARSLVGDEMPPRDGREEPQWRGSQGRKAFQAGALAAAAVGTAQPRPVSFAYVAQPGGKLWRVALSDGEVDSTYRPLGIAHFNGCTNKNGSTGQGLGGASAESGEIMEIGQLWPVYVGDLESQVRGSGIGGDTWSSVL